MNQGTFEVSKEEASGSSTPTTEAESAFSMAASLTRIDALAESLSDLTRKRVGERGHYRAKKRPSIGSVCSGAGTSMCSGSSLAIDELASIDSTFLAASCGSIDGLTGGSVDLGISRLTLGDEASTTSARLTNGMWSLQDVEPWCCSICTFENEPVFLSCEMCGQSKAASQRVTQLNNQQRRSMEEQERTRLLQEQRLRELQERQERESLPIPAVLECKKRRKKRSSNRNSGNIPSGMASVSSVDSNNRGDSRRKSSHNNNSSVQTNTAPATMDDLSLQNVFDDFSSAVHKPHRKQADPNESAATERTFDMDQSAMTSSTMDHSHMMDHSYLGQSNSRTTNNHQWQPSRRTGAATASNNVSKYTNTKNYRHTQQWFEGMDEISDEISV